MNMNDETERAYQRGLYILERRPHSRHELTEKLSRNSEPEAAEEAIEAIAELGLLDDRDFAYRLAEELFKRKRLSSRRVEYELSRKGVEAEIINEVLDSLEEEIDTDSLLDELIAQKYAGNLGDEKGIRRTVAALSRRGYGYGEIRAAIDRATVINS